MDFGVSTMRVETDEMNSPARKLTNYPAAQTEAPGATPTAKTPAGVPTWMDVFNDFMKNTWAPYQRARGEDPNAVAAWNVGDDTRRGKALLDQEYIDKLAAYNKEHGTNHQPDKSVLGPNAQPTKPNWEPGHGGWLENKLGIKPEVLALIGAGIATGGFGLLGGAGASTGAASGLAGSLGMNAGAAATALNAGVLNAGVTVARGGNLGDALKSGLTGAALSGVGGWAKDVAGGALTSAGVSSGISNTLSTIGSKAVTGGLGAALTGGDWRDGAINGAIAGGVSAASSAAGDWVKGETADMGKGVSDFAGRATSALTSTALKGGNLETAAGNLAGSYAGSAVGGWAKETTGSDEVGSMAGLVASNALQGKSTTTQGLLGAYLQGSAKTAVKSKDVFKASGVEDPMNKKPT